jgi:hypothetical protein
MWTWIAKQAVKVAAWAIPRADDLQALVALVLSLKKKKG